MLASSGTAFTEAQVRLLSRYSKNIIVNFDPDAAGAAAAERSLALLVAEDFRIDMNRRGLLSFEHSRRPWPVQLNTL